MEEKKKRLTLPLSIDLPDPMQFLEEAEITLSNIEETISGVEQKAKEIDKKVLTFDKRFSAAKVLETRQPIKTETPASGKTFEGQSDESYCLECVEGHTMGSLTEIGHAIDRFRSAGKMTSGVTEKVRVAIQKLQGITEDITSTENASPDVKEGLDEILDEVRWIRKEHGISGGLTRGIGTMEDLETLRTRISAINLKAYELVEKCPSCKIVSKDLRHRMKEGKQKHE